MTCPRPHSTSLGQPGSGNHLGEPTPAPSDGARRTESQPFLDSDAAHLPGARNAPLWDCPLLFLGCEGKGCDPEGKGGVGKRRVCYQLEEHPRPAGLDPNVHMMEMSSQPRAPPSQGENPTSGEHLDQTAAMKAQHQTRVLERPSPQALLQEKLQIFLLEAFKCHRTPQVWDRSSFTETDVPE